MDVKHASIFESLGTVQGRLLRLEMVVLLSALILAILVLYGATRRRSSDNLLLSVMWMAYSLSYVVVSYAVGLIQDGPFHGETFVLWATALLLIQASVYSTPVHSRRDIDQRKKLLLQHVLQTALVLWLILNASGGNVSYRAIIWAFWSLNVLKTSAKIVEMVKASRPDSSVKVVADYMDVEEFLTSQLRVDPKRMEGYQYLFHGEDTMTPIEHKGGHLDRDTIIKWISRPSVVTIDKVYRWIDQQGYSEVEKDKVRDFCLAFALFKLLKRRFYGHIPLEAGSKKTSNLVCSGLIYDNPTGPDPAFHVIKVELAFLYDFFYTRNIVPVGPKVYICIAISLVGLTMWAAVFGTFGPAYRYALDSITAIPDFVRAVTVVIVMIAAVLELYQALAGFSSNWRYIEDIYRCVRDNQTWGRRRQGLHLWWKESFTPTETKYWEDKIGTYVLLESFNHRPWNVLSWLTLYLVEPRREGQKRNRKRRLTTDVKRAVLVSFKKSNGQIANGLSTMQRHVHSQDLRWAWELTLIDQILVWHIVTTCCDWASTSPTVATTAQADSITHRHVATTLSNYCAYLVAFVPEMLPGPSYNTEIIFDTAVRQTRDHLDKCKRKDRKLDMIKQIQRTEQAYWEHGGDERPGSKTIIERAALLRWQFKTAISEDELRWRVLAEFWAEFVLFLAPSDNVDIHAEMLGAGGEFMTQLWVLLTHAGVLERPAGTTPVPTTDDGSMR